MLLGVLAQASGRTRCVMLSSCTQARRVSLVCCSTYSRSTAPNSSFLRGHREPGVASMPAQRPAALPAPARLAATARDCCSFLCGAGFSAVSPVLD